MKRIETIDLIDKPSTFTNEEKNRFIKKFEEL